MAIRTTGGGAAADDLNLVDFNEVAEEIFGPDMTAASAALQRQHLERIEQWLGHWTDGPGYAKPRALRMAPSLVSRSDAELYGVSLPRFAVRFFLGGPNSFMNLRRAWLLAQQARRCISDGDPADGRRGEAGGNGGDPSGIRFPRVIGDSVLGVPAWLPLDRYHVNTRDFGALYGEHRPCTGTAYVQYSDQIGACAHAVCFMASMALGQEAKGVFGLPEISALLHEHERAQFPIGGLTGADMENYFRHRAVGLNSTAERIARHQPEGSHSDAAEQFGRALRTYCLSGMPVIVPVDEYRLFGVGSPRCEMDPVGSVYRTNGAGVRLRAEVLRRGVRRRPHCLLVMGCAKDPQKDRFLAHDPSLLPYLVVSSLQLNSAAPYADESMSDLRRFVYQPVVPGAVRLPLHLTSARDAVGEGRIGVWRIAMQVQKSGCVERATVVGPEELGESDFRLMQWKDAAAAIFQARRFAWRIMPAGGPSVWKRIRRELARVVGRISGSHWVWVQKCSRSVWIWDAEMDPPSVRERENEELLAGYLVATAGQRGLVRGPAWGAIQARERMGAGDARGSLGEASLGAGWRLGPCGDGGEPGHAEVSLITSFDRRGYEFAGAAWPDRVKKAEVYLMMQSDVARVSGRLGLARGTAGATAAEWMAAHCEDARVQAAVADDIARSFNGKAEVGALATFVPEVAAGRDGRAELGLNALRFAVRLVPLLRSRGHDVRVIELVGGGIATGLREADRQTKDTRHGWLVDKKTLQSACASVFGRLDLLAPDLAEADAALAFEMEPGPLFAFGSPSDPIAALGVICECMDQFVERNALDPGLVGLNLDIGHFMIAKLRPGDLPAWAREKIGHAHVSDHGAGHFGDSVVASLSDEESFVQWLALLLEEVGRVGRARFSGLVSVEIECACCIGCVRRSADKTMRALRVARLRC